jgi:predicted rRNA methylase YqxC with S4 and FtsJ domains
VEFPASEVGNDVILEALRDSLQIKLKQEQDVRMMNPEELRGLPLGICQLGVPQ